MSKEQEAAREQDLGKKVFAIESPEKRQEVQRILDAMRSQAAHFAQSDPHRAMMCRATAGALAAILGDKNGTVPYAIIQIGASNACRRQLTRGELKRVMEYVAKAVPLHGPTYGRPRSRRQSPAA